MSSDEENKLVVKFPEDKTPGGTILAGSPDNPIDKAADFIPKALNAIKGNFRESVYLVTVLGYIFIAALGHMEKFQNYIGYFFVLAVSVVIYKIWEKILFRDLVYLIIIIVLSSYLIFIKFSSIIIAWLK